MPKDILQKQEVIKRTSISNFDEQQLEKYNCEIERN